VCRPFSRGILGHVEVNNLTSSMAQDDEYKKQAKSNRGYDEKIDANHVRHVILDESSPRLRGRFPSVPTQQIRDRPLGDVYAKFEQFAVNFGSAPQRIGIRHFENQRPHIRIYRRPSAFAGLRLPTPVALEGALMPSHNGVRLNNKYDIAPSRQDSGQQHPE